MTKPRMRYLSQWGIWTCSDGCLEGWGFTLDDAYTHWSGLVKMLGGQVNETTSLV